MKQILSVVFSTIVGMSVFFILTCMILNAVTSIPFVGSVLRDVIIVQIFVFVIGLLGLALVNFVDIAKWVSK